MFGCVVYPCCHSWDGKALKTVEWGTGFRYTYYDGIYTTDMSVYKKERNVCLGGGGGRRACLYYPAKSHVVLLPKIVSDPSPRRRRLANIVLRSFGADSENIKTNSVEWFSSSPKRHVSVTLCIYTLHMNGWMAHKSSDERTNEHCETTDARGWQMAHGQKHWHCDRVCTHWGGMWILCTNSEHRHLL